MPKLQRRQEFNIHVDPSCLTDSTDLMMQGKRSNSDQTVIHHESEDAGIDDVQGGCHDGLDEGTNVESHDEHEASESEFDIDESLLESQGGDSEFSDQLSHGQSYLSSLVSTDSHTDALIHAAAQAVVASIEESGYGQEDSVLSARTEDDDHPQEDSFISERTDQTHGDGDDGSPQEDSFISEHTDQTHGDEDVHDPQEDSIISERTNQTHGEECGNPQDSSIIVERMDESHKEDDEGVDSTYVGTAMTGDETAQSYDPNVELHEDDAYDGSTSSHHDDDVFSQDNRHSNRSSINSLSDPHTDDDTHNDREESQHATLESINTHLDDQDQVSRVPSTSSNGYSLIYSPQTITAPTFSGSMSRPPFRSPSSVRAIQMSSPTPSVFGSPRSSKRPNQTASRLGTPQQSPSKIKSPGRFKAKKEYPLVLLHVTVLPLHWSFAPLMDSHSSEIHDWSQEALAVRQSWRLIQEKLGSMVLERGILLPHPQDDFEILEERLLDALELPVRPRAKILSCGHYIGPEEETDLSSDEDASDEDVEQRQKGTRGAVKQKWCDICGRDVKYESFTPAAKQKRFGVKVYASNGLMRAGAWSAAWREMERVDVEIEPFVPVPVYAELEKLTELLQELDREERAAEEGQMIQAYVEHEYPVEHENPIEHQPPVEYEVPVEHEAPLEHEAPIEPEPLVELEGPLEKEVEAVVEPVVESVVEQLHPEKVDVREEIRALELQQDQIRRIEANDDRMREVYGFSPPRPEVVPSAKVITHLEPRPEPAYQQAQQEEPLYEQQRPYPRQSQRPQQPYHQSDSLPTLLLAALRVSMRDRKNLMICILSALVLLLAVRAGSSQVPTPYPPFSFTPSIYFPANHDNAVSTKTELAAVAQSTLHVPQNIAPAVRREPVGAGDQDNVMGNCQNVMRPESNIGNGKRIDEAVKIATTESPRCPLPPPSSAARDADIDSGFQASPLVKPSSGNDMKMKHDNKCSAASISEDVIGNNAKEAEMRAPRRLAQDTASRCTGVLL